MKPASRRKRLRTDSTTITESKALHAVSALPDIIDSAAPSPASIIEDSRDSIPESKEPLQADTAKNIVPGGQGLVSNEPVQEAIPENQPLVPIEPAQAEHEVSEPSKSEEALVPQIEDEAQNEQAEPTTKRKARAAANRPPPRRSLPRRGQAKATTDEPDNKDDSGAEKKEQVKDDSNEIEEAEEINVRSVRKSTRQSTKKSDLDAIAKRSRRSRGKRSEEAENLGVDEDSSTVEVSADVHPVPDHSTDMDLDSLLVTSSERAKSGDKVEIEPDDVSGASGISSEKVSSIPSSDSMPELNAICSQSAEQDSTGSRSVPELTPERELVDSVQTEQFPKDGVSVQETKTKRILDDESDTKKNENVLDFSVLATWNVASEDGETETEAEVDVMGEENKVPFEIPVGEKNVDKESEQVETTMQTADTTLPSDDKKEIKSREDSVEDDNVAHVSDDLQSKGDSVTVEMDSQKPETEIGDVLTKEKLNQENVAAVPETTKAEPKLIEFVPRDSPGLAEAKRAIQSEGDKVIEQVSQAQLNSQEPQKEPVEKEGRVEPTLAQAEKASTQETIQPTPALQNKPSVIGQPSQYEDISDAEDLPPSELQEKPAAESADPNVARKSPFVPLEEMAKYEVEIIREEDIQKSNAGVPQEKAKKAKAKKQIDLPAGVEEILNEYSEAISQTKPGGSGSKEGSVSGASAGAARRDSPAFGVLSGAGSRRSSVDSGAGTGENVELANMLLMLSQQSNSSGSDRSVM